MKKILQIGTKGQLGWELLRTCAPLGEVVALDYPDVDLSDSIGLRALVKNVKPDIIINAAAYTNVDKAESEPELARAINATGPGVLAEEAKKINAVLLHYSTDYVFDGTKYSPYVETDTPNPLNVYGQTKLEGEQAVAASGCVNLVLRTSWVYSMRQGGFVTKVLQWARTQEVMRVVDDQISSPTSRLMAEITNSLVSRIDATTADWIFEHKGYTTVPAVQRSCYDWRRKYCGFIQICQNNRLYCCQYLQLIFQSRHSTLKTCLDSSKLKPPFGMKIPHWLNALELGAMRNRRILVNV